MCLLLLSVLEQARRTLELASLVRQGLLKAEPWEVFQSNQGGAETCNVQKAETESASREHGHFLSVGVKVEH